MILKSGVEILNNRPIANCPACNATLRITELSCPRCKTKITTDLETCRYCGLPDDLRHFMHTFLACRGNIKEVERHLAISYPTVRKRLDELVVRLRIKEEAEHSAPRMSRTDVFEKLRKGEITVEDAVDLLGEGTPE